MSIFKRTKKGFTAPQGVTFTPYEPMNTLRKIEIAIMKLQHEKMKEFLKASRHEQAYLNPYIDGLQDAYEIVRAESKRLEDSKNETK
jgi:hypothetical protein